MQASVLLASRQVLRISSAVFTTGFQTMRTGMVESASSDWAMVREFLAANPVNAETTAFIVADACGDRDARVQEANLFDLQAKYAEVVSEAVAIGKFEDHAG